jgi:hypothetical protein
VSKKQNQEESDFLFALKVAAEVITVIILVVPFFFSEDCKDKTKKKGRKP